MSWSHQLEFILPLSILALLAVFTNIMVCVLVSTKRDLRSHTNRFVVSLAASDILTSVVIFVQYVVGFRSASVLNVAYALAMLSSVANLCAVTFDRYLAVLRPFQYTQQIARSSRKIIVACWVVPGVVSVLPLAWGGNVDTVWHKIFVFTVLSLGIVVPVFYILFADLCIYRQVRKCVQRERQLIVTNSTSSSPQPAPSPSMRFSSEVKIAQVTAIVALNLVLSWFPVIYFTTAAAIGRGRDVPVLLTEMSPFTLTLGSLVNPLLYSFMKPDFKRAIKVLLRCQHKRRTVEFALTEISAS